MTDRTRRVLLATRVFAPEAAAATFRLGALVRALAERADVEVLTVTPPPTLRGPPAVDESSSAWVVRADRGNPANNPCTGCGDEGGEPRATPPGRRVTVSRWPVLRDATGYVRGYLPYLSFDLPLALRLFAAPRPDVVVVEPPPTTGAVTRVALMVRGLAAAARDRRDTGDRRRDAGDHSSGHGRIPYVYYAADIWSDATTSMGAPAPVVWLMRRLEAFALRGARDVVAVSDGVADRVRALIGVERAGPRITVVPNGIDTEVFTPDGPVHPDAPDTPYLLYAGTASEWQGAEIFAEAMRQVVCAEPDVRLVFLGQGSSWPALQRIQDELPAGAIELRALVSPQEAAAWQRGAAAALVSVRPGMGYDFAYPTKVIAALATGAPVIFAGPGPAADDVREHRLGTAVGYDVAQVAAAMLTAVRCRATGEEAASPAERDRRVAWVREQRSLTATARAAADVVLGEH